MAVRQAVAVARQAVAVVRQAVAVVRENKTAKGHIMDMVRIVVIMNHLKMLVRQHIRVLPMVVNM